MKKFVIEDPIFEIFPQVRIGILVCRGIDNHVKDEAAYEAEYGAYLREAEKAALKYVSDPEFTANPVIRTWRDAFYKFRTKKGARCSIEAMLKRVSRGDHIGNINPLVDIYNVISLKYGLPVGGEDMDKFDGDIRLTIADGSEDFVTLGSDRSEPPYPGEVIYKDSAGAICRCFNWRESVRTMLTDDTANAFMCIETVDGASDEALNAALDELISMIESRLGGRCEKRILDSRSPEAVIG